MKKFKKVLAAVMAAAVLVAGVPTAAQAATSSPVVKSISTAKAKAPSVSYNGSVQQPTVTVTDGSTTLVAGTDYIVTYDKSSKKAGTYTATVTGIGTYSGTTTVSYTIKAIKSLSVKASKPSVKKSALKKKSAKIKLTTTTKSKGTVTYKVTKGSSKYIKVSKNGVVTLKKGAKKGTYQVQVSVQAKGNYAAASKTVTIKVK